MVPGTSFRLSGCLVASGIGVLVVSMLGLGFGLLLAVVGPGATRQASSRHDERALAAALTDLAKIPDLPEAVAEEFKRDGKVSEETLSGLSFDQRTRVRRVLADHAVSSVSSSLATASTAGIGTAVVVILFVLGIPGTIVGLLLVRRKKLWRCRACRYAFERL